MLADFEGGAVSKICFGFLLKIEGGVDVVTRGGDVVVEEVDDEVL